MAYLILIRHGQSEYNEKGLWTGKRDVSLSSFGREEARQVGESIRNIEVHSVHMSRLRRTHETFFEISEVLGLGEVPRKVHHALDERDYGTYTGKNKWQIKEQVGDENFLRIRRDWNEPIPEGETLKDVHDRIVPYFKQHIQPELALGKNVLVVSHGNTLRALVKYLENMFDEDVCNLEIATGEAYCYKIDKSGSIEGKEIRSAHEMKQMA